MTFEEWYGEKPNEASLIQRYFRAAWNAAWKARGEHDAKIAKSMICPHPGKVADGCGKCIAEAILGETK